MARASRAAALRLIPVSSAMAILILLWFVYQRVQQFDPSHRAAGVDSGAESSLTAEDAVVIARKDGRPMWRLDVDQIGLQRLPDSDLTDFHTAEFRRIRSGVVYGTRGADAFFKANAATYRKAMRRLEVDGGIEIKTTRNDRFSTRQCVWTETDDFARFPLGGNAVIDGNRIEAPEMLYATGERLLQCPRGATAMVRGQTLSAATLEYNANTASILCGGPVAGSWRELDFVANRASLDLKRRSIRANKGSVTLRMDTE